MIHHLKKGIDLCIMEAVMVLVGMALEVTVGVLGIQVGVLGIHLGVLGIQVGVLGIQIGVSDGVPALVDMVLEVTAVMEVMVVTEMMNIRYSQYTFKNI
jgi:hypothetical protein